MIDREKTRVLAEINIVGSGMRGGPWEQDLADMDGKLTGEKARQYPGLIVGIKTAHYEGPEWKPVDQAEIAAKSANIPVMVDFGDNRPERPLLELASTHMRPGDIYTHCFSGLRGEQDPVTGGPSEALFGDAAAWNLLRHRTRWRLVFHGQWRCRSSNQGICPTPSPPTCTSRR